MPWVALAVAGAAVVSGLMGAAQKASAQERADMLREQGIQQWLKVHIPDPEQQKLALQEFVVSGKLTPQFEKAVAQEPSAFQHIAQDQGLKQSKLRSLRSLETLGTGDETFGDKATQQGAAIDQAAQSRGNQKAILNSVAARGQLGTGQELSARMDQNQADSDVAAKTSLGLEANRRSNALKAIQSAGDLAGNMSSEDYKIASDAARAKDSISAFNTANLRNVDSANTKARSATDLYNNQNAQEIQNKNTVQANYQQQYNKELQQKQFDNNTKVAAGLTGQYNTAAQGAQAGGESAAQFWGNLAGTAPKVITAAADYSKKNPNDQEEEQ